MGNREQAKSPFQKSFPLAVEFFKKKIPLPTEKWNTIAAEYQSVAFVIASITKLSILQDIQKLIESQLEQGISPEAFKEQFRDALVRAGWSPGFSPYRISLILSQNVRQSMAYGRFSQMRSPEVMKTRKYWQWQHRDSVQFRPNHKAIDRKVFPADSTFWETAYPPCFPPGTMVATPTGWKAIETIQSGELVIGGSGNSQPVAAAHVTPYSGKVIRVIAEGSTETLSTPNHRFLTLRGWIRAENLQAGDVLVQISEATLLDIAISNVDQLNSGIGDRLVAVPVERQPTQTEAFNSQVDFRQEDIYPVAINGMVMYRAETKSLQMIEQDTFNLGWGAQSIDVSFRGLSQGFEAGDSSLFAYFGVEEGRGLLEFFSSASSSLVNILRLTQSRMRLAFVLPLLSDLCQYLTAQLSSFGVVMPLIGNSLARITGFNSKVFHQPHQGASVHTPAIAQLPYCHSLIDVETEEGFASGAPLDRFDSLDSFRAWSASHATLRQVKTVTPTLYNGNVYNLTVENDETYCLQASVVHNCGFGCRCAVFALNDRDLAREGLKVSTPPDPRSIADSGFKTFPKNLNEQRQQLIDRAIASLPPNLAKILEDAENNDR